MSWPLDPNGFAVPPCDAEGCDKAATFWLEVQWSIADFGEWYACDEDLEGMVDYFAKKKTDGRLPVVLDVHVIELGISVPPLPSPHQPEA